MSETSLTLELRQTPSAPVDVSLFVPNKLRDLHCDEIARRTVVMGRQAIAVGELFRISGTPSQTVIIAGDCRRLHHIGAGLKEGRIHVEGHCGDGVGTGMIGGTIQINGSAGHGVAASMRGGTIRVSGDVGDGLAAPRAGERSGMRNGQVIIEGNAGDGAGRRLRRGLVVVAGTVGRYAGAEMVAGTLVASGGARDDDAWRSLGRAMRRGSILLPRHPSLSPLRFTSPASQQLGFLQLLAGQLDSELPDFAARLRGPVRRCIGDRTVGGLGELLLTDLP